jgi:hypothetical protein
MRDNGLGCDELIGVHRRSSAAKELFGVPGSGFGVQDFSVFVCIALCLFAFICGFNGFFGALAVD